MVEYYEFVASPTRHCIPGTDDGAQPSCDFDQKLVTGAMSEAVVDLLEIVKIEEHHVDLTAAGPDGVERLGQSQFEGSSIAKVGYGIEMRHSIDDAVRVPLRGHILDDNDPAASGIGG